MCKVPDEQYWWNMSNCQSKLELETEIHYSMSTSSCESGHVSTSSYESVATTMKYYV